MSRFPGLLAVADAVSEATEAFLIGPETSVALFPSLKLIDLTEVKVTVVPMTKSWKRENRDEATRTYGMSLGIQQRIDATPAAGALTREELIELAEDLAEWWLDTKQTIEFAGPDGCTVACMEAAWNGDEPFDSDRLENGNLFQNLLGLTFMAV